MAWAGQNAVARQVQVRQVGVDKNADYKDSKNTSYYEARKENTLP
jgi:hypothetical protein